MEEDGEGTHVLHEARTTNRAQDPLAWLRAQQRLHQWVATTMERTWSALRQTLLQGGTLALDVMEHPNHFHTDRRTVFHVEEGVGIFVDPPNAMVPITVLRYRQGNTLAVSEVATSVDRVTMGIETHAAHRQEVWHCRLRRFALDTEGHMEHLQEAATTIASGELFAAWLPEALEDLANCVETTRALLRFSFTVEANRRLGESGR
jgi:hypothetical protein